ncbi:group III truncated hemoglobin [Flammeovirgaceae bacterium SG7u.111]|nr:group III truncated hemoglobin [Flammeovirgaceae bacterium SG7u.132]WPO33465.1 group III truncated hemoglobin [Flammeovirgaceae bacterium SG7u.111]
MDTKKTDILSIGEVKTLVNTFYDNVRADDLLKDIFNQKIGDRWTEHLEKMYRFWQTVLLGEHTYNGSPFPPHMQLPVEKEHFDRWQSIFHNTVDTLFTGKKADEAKWRASKMAELFHYKIEHFKASASNSLQ